MTDKHYKDLLALHEQGKLSQEDYKKLSQEERTKYNCYRYNRGAMISFIISLERELHSESPNEEQIKHYRKEIETFSRLASRFL